MSPLDAPADILVVEDDPDLSHCLVRLLEREGFSVATAENGWQALEHVRLGGPPRLVLLDLVMPEMDGWEFLRARRDHRDLWGVPVVVFSAVADSGRPDPRPLGAAEVLRKPYALAQVLEVVRRHCGAPARARPGP